MVIWKAALTSTSWLTTLTGPHSSVLRPAELGRLREVRERFGGPTLGVRPDDADARFDADADEEEGPAAPIGSESFFLRFFMRLSSTTHGSASTLHRWQDLSTGSGSDEEGTSRSGSSQRVLRILQRSHDRRAWVRRALGSVGIAAEDEAMGSTGAKSYVMVARWCAGDGLERVCGRALGWWTMR
jgi:hypothetical protein